MIEGSAGRPVRGAVLNLNFVFPGGIMIRVVGPTVLVAMVISLGGCGPGAGPSGSSSAINGTDGSFSTCATEVRATPYVKGMQVTSTSGVLTVKLLESKPGPPVKGTDTWTIEVDEVDTGTPIEGLDVVVVPYMPDHMHGTNPVLVTPAGAGTYTLAAYLYMSGYWEVRMTLGTDDAMIPICIP